MPPFPSQPFPNQPFPTPQFPSPLVPRLQFLCQRQELVLQLLTLFLSPQCHSPQFPSPRLMFPTPLLQRTHPTLWLHVNENGLERCH